MLCFYASLCSKSELARNNDYCNIANFSIWKTIYHNLLRVVRLLSVKLAPSTAAKEKGANCTHAYKVWKIKKQNFNKFGSQKANETLNAKIKTSKHIIMTEIKTEMRSRCCKIWDFVELREIWICVWYVINFNAVLIHFIKL